MPNFTLNHRCGKSFLGHHNVFGLTLKILHTWPNFFFAVFSSTVERMLDSPSWWNECLCLHHLQPTFCAVCLDENCFIVLGVICYFLVPLQFDCLLCINCYECLVPLMFPYSLLSTSNSHDSNAFVQDSRGSQNLATAATIFLEPFLLLTTATSHTVLGIKISHGHDSPGKMPQCKASSVVMPMANLYAKDCI